MATDKKTTPTKKTTAAKKPKAAAKTTKPKTPTKPKATTTPKAKSTPQTKPLKVNLGTNKTQKPNKKFLLLWVFVLVLIGTLILQQLIGSSGIPASSIQTLDNGEQIIVHDGKTWIPFDGAPIPLTVVSDKTCGQSCDPSEAIASFKQGIAPTIIPNIVDANSTKGKSLVTEFDIKGLPAYIFGSEIAELSVNDQKFIEAAAQILTEKNGQYLIQNGPAGIRTGKFITPPAFDNSDDPVIGSGPVMVVEFTDLQCPYCQRFANQNKDLLQEMIDNGTITYVTKDFPLAFHSEAPKMHKASNCILANNGTEMYQAFKMQVFDNQSDWSGKSGQEDFYATKYAARIGAQLDTDACFDGDNSEIDNDMAEGKTYGVSGTPAIFVGTQIMPGAVGPDVLRAAIEAEAKNQ